MNALLERAPRRLWSFWDMLRIYADQYIALGEGIQEIRVIYHFLHHDDQRTDLTPDEAKDVRLGLANILRLCNELDLPVAFDLIKSRAHDIPATEREFDLLIAAVYSELKNKTFLYVRPHLGKFYDNHEVLSDQATLAFPMCRNELWDSSNALASELWTAAVFHSMRAAEIGVRVLAADLGVSFPDKTLDQAEWAQLLDQADSKIKAISQQPKSEGRDKDQHFYSTAAAEFRYFKDGWRVRVAHSKASYTKNQATKIFEHTRDFFEALSVRLKE